MPTPATLRVAERVLQSTDEQVQPLNMESPGTQQHDHKRRQSWPTAAEPKRHDTVRYEDTLRNVAFARRGTPYPATDEQLITWQDEGLYHKFKPWRPLPRAVTLEEAHAKLEALAHAAATPSQEQARGRLRSAYNMPPGAVGLDLAIKISSDMDTLLFGGELHHRVLVMWSHIPHYERTPSALMPPPTYLRRRLRAMIILDSRLRLRAHTDPTILWTMLLHEMLHAYLYIWTGGEWSMVEDSTCAIGESTTVVDDTYLRGHGPLFFRACHVLAWRLGFPEITPSQIFGYGRGLRWERPLTPPMPRDHLGFFEQMHSMQQQEDDMLGAEGGRRIYSGLDAIPQRRRHSIAGRCLGVERTDAARGRRVRWAYILEKAPPPEGWRSWWAYRMWVVMETVEYYREGIERGLEKLRQTLR